MALAAPVEELQPVAARNIIEHLRRGSVPVDQVTYFTVGRERWLSIIEDDLTNYIAAGGAKVRFLNGDYGDGKTHFLSVIQHMVQQAGFAVSFVVLTREVPMHKFELVYREIVSRLSTAAGTTGLRGLLTHWLESLQSNQQQAPAGIPHPAVTPSRLSRADYPLRRTGDRAPAVGQCAQRRLRECAAAHRQCRAGASPARVLFDHS